MKKILDKIKNIFKVGLKTANVDLINVELEYLGKRQEAVLLVPYGMHIKTPSDMLAAIHAQEANEDSLMTFLTDIKNRDEIDGDEGFNLGIPTLKARILFKDTDKIIFKIGDIEGGDFIARFNELKSGFDELKQDFNNFITNQHNSSVVPHTHTFNYDAGTTPSSGTTDTAVITTGTTSTASIDNAKIEEIELPEL